MTKAAGARAGAENSLSEVFHENTKLGPLSARAYSAWILQLQNRSRARNRRCSRAYKAYTLMERRELPPVGARTELERTHRGTPLDPHLLRRADGPRGAGASSLFHLRQD